MWRLAVPIWALALSGGPVLAQDESPMRRAVDGEVCPVALPEWATSAERYAWDRICIGEVADMRRSAGAEDGAGCDALADAPWPDSRRLSSRFLRLIVAREPFVSAPARPAVRIRCASIEDRLRLEDEVVPQSLWIDASRLPSGAALVETRFGGYLAIDGSNFGTGALDAGGIEVARNLYLRNGVFAEVDLRDASVGGILSTGGSRFAGWLRADEMKVGGPAFLNDGAEFGEVRLVGASVGGNLTAAGSRFTGLFDADRLTVGGDLYLTGESEFAGVDLPGATIGGLISTEGARFAGLFNADDLRVGGGLFLRNAAFAQVRLTSANVAGNLQMQGSVWSGPVDMTGLTAGGLALWAGEGSEPVWSADADLTLRNVELGALQARMPESWIRSDGTALPVDLQGLRYARLGGTASGADADLARIDDPVPLIAWLESSPRGAGHRPQPYFQMEEVLRGMGADVAADEVAYARHLNRLQNHGSGLHDWFAWAGDWLLRALVGFGVYPFRILWWFAALVGVGVLAARRSAAMRGGGWADSFWYSLENAFPLLQPSAATEAIVHDHPGLRNFFHFQKVAGFVLATILVGALSLLGG